MIRRVVFAFVVVLCLSFSAGGSAQDPERVAKVYLKIVVAPNGEDLDDLEPAKITFFKSKIDGHDYARRFRGNVASDIPYGVYQLRLYQTGFASAEREVVVKQSEVWVVVGLHPGEISGDPWAYELFGTVRNIPSSDRPVWVRYVGVQSTLVGDAQVDGSGSFVIAGLRRDRGLLIVWSGKQILDVRPVDVPTDEALLIDLTPGKR